MCMHTTIWQQRSFKASSIKVNLLMTHLTSVSIHQDPHLVLGDFLLFQGGKSKVPTPTNKGEHVPL